MHVTGKRLNNMSGTRRSLLLISIMSLWRSLVAFTPLYRGVLMNSRAIIRRSSFSPLYSSDYFAAIDGMKVAELKEHLRRLNKPVSGTKGVLQDRLKAALEETPVSLTGLAPKGKASVDDEGDEEEWKPKTKKAAVSPKAEKAIVEEEEDDEDQILPPDDDDEEEDGYGGGRGSSTRSASSRQSLLSRDQQDDGNAINGRGWVGEDWIEATEDEVELGQEMEAEVLSFSDLGITVRLDGRYRGLIYEDELDYQSQRRGLRVGDRTPVYVQKVRADGKVDVSFRKYGTFPKLQDGKQVVLDALLESPDGSLPLGDKSDSQDIVSQLGISKSQFKAAVGMLYKARYLSTPEANRIVLLPESERGSDMNAGDDGASSGSWSEGRAPAFKVRDRGDFENDGEGGDKFEGNWAQLREEKKWIPTKVFIRGLPFSLTEEDVEKMMAKIGPVVQIRGMVRRDDGRPSGVAWVEYQNESDAVIAKQVFNGKTFRGRYLEVFTMEEMRNDQHRRDGGGGGGRGGGVEGETLEMEVEEEEGGSQVVVIEEEGEGEGDLEGIFLLPQEEEESLIAAKEEEVVPGRIIMMMGLMERRILGLKDGKVEVMEAEGREEEEGMLEETVA